MLSGGFGMSDTKRQKRIGERHDPWGTPVFILKIDEEKFWKFIKPFLFFRKLCKMFSKSFGIFKLRSFFIRYM